jgi:UDP-N-acetylglucosamine/UDP-N-acetylgalactosamine 4-epimerase
MTTAYQKLRDKLALEQSRWLVTGVAGFIGSNLLETLLGLDQQVTGLDSFSTGHQINLEKVRQIVGEKRWANFRFVEGDIRDLNTCRECCDGVDFVLHQAALGSVPRSLDDPIASNESNVDGFLNMLVAARDSSVRRFVYAASSSTYGDHPDLPKLEDRIGNPLSPYAVTKLVNELYASVFSRAYGLSVVGLRYFNVFGPRQDPNGAYAAVIPKWIAALSNGEAITINGDGATSRDFCFVDNAVQANILSALASVEIKNEIINVAFGEQTSLNELFDLIKNRLKGLGIRVLSDPLHGDFRPGDVKHSLASVEKAKQLLGYSAEFDVRKGLSKTIVGYVNNMRSEIK